MHGENMQLVCSNVSNDRTVSFFKVTRHNSGGCRGN